jgi:hypothetical protein
MNEQPTKDSPPTVPVPQVKHELVLSKCANNRAISVCIATHQALAWIKLCDCYFNRLTVALLAMSEASGNRLPMDTVLIVPECYDFNEVWNFIASKPFAHQMGQKQSDPDSEGWTVQASDYDRVSNALRALRNACEDRLPPGHYEKLEEECREADVVLGRKTKADKP